MHHSSLIPSSDVKPIKVVVLNMLVLNQNSRYIKVELFASGIIGTGEVPMTETHSASPCEDRVSPISRGSIAVHHGG